MKDTLERWLGTLFGLIFVALSLVVAVETALRKLFNISLQGADELGGYALAVGATIAFSLALIANTVSMPAPTASANPAALQEMI
mgnify:CR=1 FL=1